MISIFGQPVIDQESGHLRLMAETENGERVRFLITCEFLQDINPSNRLMPLLEQFHSEENRILDLANEHYIEKMKRLDAAYEREKNKEILIRQADIKVG